MKKNSLLPSLLPSLFTLVFGSVMSGVILYFLLEKESSKVELETTESSHVLKESIQAELIKSKSFLRGIQGLFYSQEFVTRKEFRIFCKSFISKNDPIHIVEWQPKVLKSDRKLYEQRAREDGIDGFHFFEISKEGKEIPAKEREVYFPVFYSYSPDDVETVGLDIAFSPVRMKSKFESMKLGHSMASETFGLILKDQKTRNLGMAFSDTVFRDYKIEKTDSIDLLKGFLAIVIDLNKFFKPIVSSDRFNDFQFEVKDEGSEGKIIFSNLKASEVLADFVKYNSIELKGRTWGIYLYPKIGLYSKMRSLIPWVIFGLTLLISIVLSFYLYFKNLNQMKLRVYERKLEQKQRLESIGMLASGIAHEFNNVLQGIVLINDNLRDILGDHNLENEYVETSSKLCERGRDLVRQILSFARKETLGRVDILPSVEINKSVNFLKSSLGSDITFRLSVEDEDLPLSMGPHHLSQIIVNICNNAAHAMDSKGIIDIIYECRDKYRLILIKDNGVGMDEQTASRVFDPFFTTKEVNEGTGLGLSIIYGIIKSYNGEITVKSTKGVGTEFKIILPNDHR